MTIIFPVIIALVLLTVGDSVFKRYNMGLARNSLGQQMRRYIIGALQSVLPMALTGVSAMSAPILAAMGVALLWMGTYNILYDKTHRASSPDYDNHMDIAFGI